MGTSTRLFTSTKYCRVVNHDVSLSCLVRDSEAGWVEAEKNCSNLRNCRRRMGPPECIVGCLLQHSIRDKD